MEMKTIYIMDCDVLRGTNSNHGIYENIPMCLKQGKYVNIDVESIPKEKEVILMKKNNSLKAMSVFKVVYYEWKIFVIVNNSESNLRLVEKESDEELSKFAGRIASSF